MTLARSSKSLPKVADAPFQLPRQKRARESLERILVAAERLINEGGSDAFTMNALADAAQVSIGGIYNHFRDRGSILVAVQHRVLSRIEAEIEARAANAGDSLESLISA